MVALKHCTGEERVKEGRLLDLALMQALCSSGQRGGRHLQG